jgi:diguanylate cyclase (GGDEF)-like protein
MPTWLRPQLHGWTRRLVLAGSLVGLVAAAELVGLLAPLSAMLSDARFRLVSRPASGTLAIVAIDEASIRAIGVWPWNRDIHARTLDALMTLGATDVAFDIDFSSPSSEGGDAAFEAALARAEGRASLAAFSDPARPGGLVSPLPRFAAQAWTACVDVDLDRDGRLRSFASARATADGPCISMPLMLAGGSAETGGHFAIDYSIQPQTIPQIGVGEVLSGAVDREAVAGRRVIVGATATALRDFFLVPVHGVVSGPMVQALAYETALQDRRLTPAPRSVTLAGLAAIGLLGLFAFPLPALLALAVALGLGTELAAALLQTEGHTILATAPWQMALVLMLVAAVTREMAARTGLLALLRRENRHIWMMLDKLIQDNFAGIIVADGQGTVRMASREAAGILGLGAGEALVGRPLDAVLPPALRDAVQAALASHAVTGTLPREPVEIACSSGTDEPRILEYLLTPTALGSSGPTKPGGVAACLMVRDVTARTMEQARVEALARIDTLTQIPNRNLFFERLEAALGRAETARIGLAYFDLDGFKAVNDSFGHATGDALLRAVAETLAPRLPASALLARLGGDEFAILVELPAGTEGELAETLAATADLVADAVAAPFAIGPLDVRIGASVGLAAWAAGEGADDLMHKADAALYMAKREGKHRARFYDSALHDQLREAAALREDLAQAFHKGELHVAFQPQVVLGSGDLVGAEALLRWTCPRRGAVSPAVFVPIAEEIGLIEAIGTFVLREACREAAAWPSPLMVAVNISSRQVVQGDLCEVVQNTLRETGLPAHRLELEITESLFLDDAPIVAETLSRLRSLGVEIALDDFGTGYSSLGYIRRFPVTKVKIDRSFVTGLPLDVESTAIIRAIVSMCDSLKLKTIAEGIETREQAQMLRLLGCGEGQGYLFGKPQSAASFHALAAPARRLA